MSEAARVLLALVQFAPEIRDAVAKFWGHHGAALNLGPLPPDMAKNFAAVDAQIDELLKASKR